MSGDERKIEGGITLPESESKKTIIDGDFPGALDDFRLKVAADILDDAGLLDVAAILRRLRVSVRDDEAAGWLFSPSAKYLHWRESRDSPAICGRRLRYACITKHHLRPYCPVCCKRLEASHRKRETVIFSGGSGPNAKTHLREGCAKEQ